MTLDPMRVARDFQVVQSDVRCVRSRQQLVLPLT